MLFQLKINRTVQLTRYISSSRGWRPRFEYTFTFDGRTVAGVPSLGRQEHTGIHYYGTLRVQRDVNDVLLMKVTIENHLNNCNSLVTNASRANCISFTECNWLRAPYATRLTNPSFLPFMYVVEWTVYYEITIPPNIHAMNQKLFSFMDILGNIWRCNTDRNICTSLPFNCLITTTATWHDYHQLIRYSLTEGII